MRRSPRMPTRWLGGGIAAVFLLMDVAPVLAGPQAYLVNLDDLSITVLDTTSLTETATIALPDMLSASAIVAGASGTSVYASYHNDTPTGGLAVIDVATHVVRTVSFGQVAAGLAVDVTESRAFLADVAEVAVVDLAGPALATTFSDGTRFPFDVAIDHATGRLYVTNFDGFVSVHDGITFAPIASIPADFDLQIIALSRGSTIGAANSGVGITIFDTSTNTAIGEVPTGVTPSEMVVTDDGTTVWALAKETNLALAIDVATLAVTTIPVGNAPRGRAFDARGTRLFVGNSADRTLSVVDPVTKTVVTTVPLTHQPAWIAVVPTCGDGAIGPNEECDYGDANGTAASCCSTTCTAAPAGTACANPNSVVCGFSTCDAAARCRYTIAPRSDCKAPATPHAASPADGIRDDAVNGLTLRHLRILGTYDGVRLNYVKQAVLEDLDIENSALGIRVNDGRQNIISECTVLGTRVEQGILVYYSPGSVVSGTISAGTARKTSAWSTLRARCSTTIKSAGAMAATGCM
jgi:YVTN family beta-propeller protein/cysteine-rich repeat protein